MATEKFLRYAAITIGTEYSVEGLRVRFEIKRSVGGYDSIAYIEIYNLAPEKKGALQEDSIPIQLIGGYENNRAVLFSGIVGASNSYKDGVDIVTEVWARDLVNLGEKYSNVSIRNPRDLKQVITRLASNASIPVGEINVAEANFTGPLTFSESFVYAMNKLASNFNFIWYILDGQLRVYSIDRTSAKRIYTFSASTGLLETPILTEIGVDAVVLLEPSITPFDLYEVQSTGVRVGQAATDVRGINLDPLGEQKVLDLVHTGDTHADQWITRVRGQASGG